MGSYGKEQEERKVKGGKEGKGKEIGRDEKRELRLNDKEGMSRGRKGKLLRRG